MSKKKKKKKQSRADPGQKRTAAFLTTADAYDMLCCSGYTRLSQCPEIIAAVNKIAALIAGMTIYLMENTDNGDKRVKNALSRMIDITPNNFMTKKTFIAFLVRTMLLEGDGNAIALPVYDEGFLRELEPIPASRVSYIPLARGYKVLINGIELDPDEVLHFVLNPDPEYPWKGCGYRVTLKEVANNLKQAAETKKGFMESKWKPSMIVKVDGLVDEFSSKEGRKKLLESFVESSEAGEPWLIPADQFDIKEVRPLSLNDIAISDSVKMDKKTVAAILDVPPFVVGEGEYREKEWDNFVTTRIMDICRSIDQEYTKKLLISERWYFKFNARSIYSYNIEQLSRVGYDGYTRGLITGNEVRGWLDLSPADGLDEFVILENYIPQGMIGEQSKLKGGDE